MFKVYGSRFAGLGTVDAVPPALERREYPEGGVFHVEQVGSVEFLSVVG